MEGYLPLKGIDAKLLAAGVEAISKGGVVAFPTETYYGLAVDPFNQQALRRLFAIKKRNQAKPILILIREESQLELLTSETPSLFRPLMQAFWPGALTLVFPCRPQVPALITGGTQTVGVRISSHPIAASLVNCVGGPITATSANISGFPAAVTAQEVREQLGRDVDIILDGGPTPGGSGSTIVSQEEGGLKLIRPGVIPFTEIIRRAGGR
jgi:L-threonylcarbamoyladenylate synthase